MNGAIEWDTKDNINKAPKDRNTKHLTDIIDAIQECGVSFNVWEKKNADGKGSGVYEFTSLTGSDKKRLLKHLPDKLKDVINPHESDSVVKIWKVIITLLSDKAAKSRLELKHYRSYTNTNSIILTLQDFGQLYEKMNMCIPTAEQVTDFFQKACTIYAN